jgi:uroporphyrinogen decarboxylase
MENVRRLFLDIMNYQPVDRMPVMHWTGWPETLIRWQEEGMPKGVNENDFFDTPGMGEGYGIKTGLFPSFPEEMLEETDEYKIIRQGDGVIAQHWKKKSCIPHFVDFTIKGTDGQGWDEYKKRLQPDPKRLPKDLDSVIRTLPSEAKSPITISAGSLIGSIRDWVGVENLAFIAYDNRDLLKEMVKTLADLTLWWIDEIGKRKGVIDLGWGWEDICFKNGPLISPDIFQECCVPHYQRISGKLREYGCHLHMVDCDGVIDALVPGWLESGVNVMFPFEIGPHKSDPALYRKKYGKELRIFGGIDKLELEKGPKAIDAEIQRRIPLMKEGGFVPLPDHIITPGTSLENYRYYLKKLIGLRI